MGSHTADIANQQPINQQPQNQQQQPTTKHQQPINQQPQNHQQQPTTKHQQSLNQSTNNQPTNQRLETTDHRPWQTPRPLSPTIPSTAQPTQPSPTIPCTAGCAGAGPPPWRRRG